MRNAILALLIGTGLSLAGQALPQSWPLALEPTKTTPYEPGGPLEGEPDPPMPPHRALKKNVIIRGNQLINRGMFGFEAVDLDSLRVTLGYNGLGGFGPQSRALYNRFMAHVDRMIKHCEDPKWIPGGMPWGPEERRRGLENLKRLRQLIDEGKIGGIGTLLGGEYFPVEEVRRLPLWDFFWATAYESTGGAWDPQGRFWYVKVDDPLSVSAVHLRSSYHIPAQVFRVDLKTLAWEPSQLRYKDKLVLPEAISPEGLGVFFDYPKEFVFMDLNTGQVVKTLKHPYERLGLSFSRDGKRLLTWGGSFRVFDMTNWRNALLAEASFSAKDGELHSLWRLSTTPGLPMNWAELSPSGRYVWAMGGWDTRTVNPVSHGGGVWDVDKNKAAAVPRDWPDCMEGWGWSDEVVFFTEPDGVALGHWKSGTVLARLKLPKGMPWRVNKHYLMASGSRPWRTLWHPDRPMVISEFLTAQGAVKFIRWDLDGQMEALKAKVAELNAKGH